ncbi:DUF4738 domain-containing protein [Flammeovirga sp. SR4]|uniref:DUF4738 domain-containing protein n=2 Tax=Flammeovirga agarivorans TaxID=2726742 RepID=A0A7X8XZD0_9BACT|nr:DUF4738 domain-containing protein [Flammeovirga agarivorans]
MSIIFFGCSEQKREKVTVKNKHESVTTSKKQIETLTISERQNLTDNNVIERFFPEENEIVKFDTIISAQNLKISIQSTALDSYVTNEYESEGIKYIDKYRDSKKHLRILYGNQVILDTMFVKESFADYAGKEFLDIANLHGYWFNKIDENVLEFFGAINKPETDWSYTFYHFFDLSTQELRIEELIEEEI